MSNKTRIKSVFFIRYLITLKSIRADLHLFEVSLYPDCIVLIIFLLINFHSGCLVSSVGRTPVCCAGGRGFEPDRTNTQGLKITEEDVLPL